jgi:ketosteroid isomerase-like protein
MSQENVEIVRRTIELWSRGDVDGALKLAGDDFVMDWSNSIGPAKGIYRGKEAARGFWTTFVEAFEGMSWDLEEIIEVDESRVIAVNHFRARGRESGIEVDAVGAQLWTISEGKERSVQLYQSKTEALEAAGLSE